MGERVYLDGIWQTTVDGSGRVLVPAHLRHELHAAKAQPFFGFATMKASILRPSSNP